MPARDLIVIGDSHCLAYDALDVLVEGDRIQARSTFVSSPEGFFTSNVWDDGKPVGQRLNETFRETLTESGADDSDQERDTVALSIGGSDAIAEAMDPLWTGFDFFLPELADLTDRSKRCLSLRAVQEWVSDRVAPLGPALDHLRDSGLTNLVVLSPPPVHRRQVDVRRHLDERGIDKPIAPVAVRAKLLFMVRGEISRAANSKGIPFVDTWPLVAEGVTLRTEFELDGFHANKDHARATIPLIMASRLSSGCASPS